MTPGYASENTSRPVRRQRRTRPGSRGTDRIGSNYETYSGESIPPPPPVPPPPPPKSYSRSGRRRPRHDDYYNRRSYNDAYYAPPPPPPPRARRPPPPPRYRDEPYPRDDYDYYDRPSRRPRERDYYDDYDDYERRPPPRKKRTAPPPPPARSSSGSRAFKIIIGIIILLLILYLFRGPILNFINDPPPLAYNEYPEGIEFTVSKSMTVTVDQNGGNGYISYKVKSACPKDRSIGENVNLQDVLDVNIQPQPDSGSPNLNSNQNEIMLWEDDHFVGSTTMNLQYKIKTWFYQWEMEEEDSLNIADIPENLKTKYNHDEWKYDVDHDDRLDLRNEDVNNNDHLDYGEDLDGDNHLDVDEDLDNDGEWDYYIEVDNPQIQSKAQELRDGQTNVFRIVRNIYDFLTSDGVLNYVTTSTGLPKVCTKTFNERSGDCDDYSILFVSLCRANDIPAWLELGVLYDKSTQKWGGHAWAKVAIPFEDEEGNIQYAAPTIDIVNKQFLIHDPYRFIEWMDTGDDKIYPGETEARNNLDYYYHTFSYTSTGNPKITSPDTNKFETDSLREFGDTKRVAADGDGLEMCMLPGFETSFLIISLVGSIIIVGTKNRKFFRYRKY